MPANGDGNVTVDGVLYPFWAQDDDTLAGARYDAAIDAQTRKKINLAAHPALSANDPDTVGDETRTHIILTGDSKKGEGMFSFGNLLGAGVASTDGKRFVDVAVDEISKVRSDVQALLALETEPTGFSKILDDQWKKVTAALDAIFETNSAADKGATSAVRLTAPREEGILDELDDILVALSNEGSFVAATEEDGDGVFESQELSTTKATDAFNRMTWTATATLGTTASTRYGTVIRKASDFAVDKLTTENGDVGAFSYSTMQETKRTSDVAAPTGIATYSGGTRAISGTRATYSGTMDLQVRFNALSVNGVVRDLLDEDGLPWQHNYTDVDRIVLSPADLRRNAQWADSGTDATVFYTAGSGQLRPNSNLQNTFQGILLGRGDAAGSEANGVWSVGAPASTTYLAGGYGVTHVADTARPIPSGDDGSASNSKLLTHVTNLAEIDSVSIEDGTLTVKLNGYGLGSDGKYDQLKPT